MSDCGTECKCEGPGYCPVYGITMGPSLYKKCKESEVWRDNFMNFCNTLKLCPFHSSLKT